MARTFTAYPVSRVREAAVQYGLDPDFVEAVYAVESSRGQNPTAMTARKVVRPKSRTETIVRGPFQLEDDTAADLMRKHGMRGANVNDPEVHLDLALKLMQDLQTRYNGNYDKMAQAYLGGAGSVGSKNKDELGTSVGEYSNRITSEMSRLRGAPPDTMYASTSIPTPLPEPAPAPPSPFQQGAEAGSSDMFGLGAMPMFTQGEGVDLPFVESTPMYAGRDAMGVPESMVGELQPREGLPDYEKMAWIERLVDEELAGRDFSIA